MKILPVASSSAGNASIITNDVTTIMIDCGVALKELESKADMLVPRVSAVLITHSHSDHLKNAGPFARKYKIPVYMNPDTHLGKEDKFKKCTVIDMLVSEEVTLGTFIVTPFSTKHDVPSYGFLIKDTLDERTLAYVTDTGMITPLIANALKQADSIFIEMDYDEVLLEEYPDYDDMLKERITSNFGHLSTQQVIAFLQSSHMDLSKNKSIVIGHLSHRTNSAELIMQHLTAAFPDNLSMFYIAPTTFEIEV